MSGILISYYFLVLVNEHVERTLKYQILISSLILTPLLWIAAYIT
jgi:hypothetical protein